MKIRPLLTTTLLVLVACAEARAAEKTPDEKLRDGIPVLLAKSEDWLVHAVPKVSAHAGFERPGRHGPGRYTGLSVTVSALADGEMRQYLVTGSRLVFPPSRSHVSDPTLLATRLLGVVAPNPRTNELLFMLVWQDEMPRRRRRTRRWHVEVPDEELPVRGLESYGLIAFDPRTGQERWLAKFTLGSSAPVEKASSYLGTRRNVTVIPIPKTARLPETISPDTAEPGLLESLDDGLKVFGCTLILDADGRVITVVAPEAEPPKPPKPK